MSYEVSHAYWHFWQPGLNATVSTEDWPAYGAYLAKARKRGSDYRMLLLALALDANAIEDVFGQSETAMCYTAIDTIAERVQRSRRFVQYALATLEKWGELEVQPCDGRCGYAGRGRKHGGTHHYYLPLPAGAELWGRKTKEQMYRGRKRRREGAQDNS